jgi:hypothetical protein
VEKAFQGRKAKKYMMGETSLQSKEHNSRINKVQAILITLKEE